jgi:hypothetical protein
MNIIERYLRKGYKISKTPQGIEFTIKILEEEIDSMNKRIEEQKKKVVFEWPLEKRFLKA